MAPSSTEERRARGGKLGCFSFYPTKNLGALGDGGAVITNDAALGRTGPGAPAVRVDPEVSTAAQGTGATAASTRSRRQFSPSNCRTWRSGTAAGEGSMRSIPNSWTARASGSRRWPAENDAAHLYVIRTPERDRIRTALAEQGIATDVHYPIPDHRQECDHGTASSIARSRSRKHVAVRS